MLSRFKPFKLLGGIATAALLAATVGFTTPARAQVDGVMSADQFSSLMARAQEAGQIRIIVGLDVATALTGPMSDDAFDAQAAAIGAAEANLVAGLGLGEADRSFTTIPYTAITVTPEQLERLQSMPGVTSVIEDVADAPFLNTSTNLTRARQLWRVNGITGAGTAVAVLDTGLFYWNRAFPSGTILNSACYSSNACFSYNGGTICSTSLCRGGVESDRGLRSAPPAPLSVSGAGHGTHVGAIVGARRPLILRGMAPGTQLIPIQVFSRFPSSYCGGSSDCVLAWRSDQMAGLERVLTWARWSYNVAAVNMSLGGGAYSAHCDAENLAYTQLIENLRSEGVAVAIATGNDYYSSYIGFPACISAATAVGATDDSDNIASFSNQAPGGLVDLMAPGVSIHAAYPDTRTSTAYLSGTSMATPHVAGAFALLREAFPNATVDELEQALRCTGVPVTRSGIAETFYRINVRAAYFAIRRNSVPNC
ncbi:MAG: hypothetical protein Kow0013_14170 [Pararhodobacter sp.]